MKINTILAATMLFAAGSAVAGDDLKKGKMVYDTACFACHAAGVAGAPKMGDKAAWAPRIKAGLPVMKEHALKGYTGKSGVMPAKGGRADLSDADVSAAVAYMASQGK